MILLESVSKTINFVSDRALPVKLLVFTSFMKRPIRDKILLKVFGKGFGEEPFLRKVFPDKYI